MKQDPETENLFFTPPFLGLVPEGPALDKRKVSILPIPFDGGASWVPGARFGPEAVLSASTQVELWDEELEWDLTGNLAIDTLPPLSPCLGSLKEMNQAIGERVKSLIDPEAFLFSVGGDHSITYPLVQAHREILGPLKVMHLDAHADLRDTWDGTPLSHACVMRRVLELGVPVAQLGIRSLCREEARLYRERKDLLKVPARLAQSRKDLTRLFEFLSPGKDQAVYLSLDVDALDPSLIPGTGTPEPGGLSWEATLTFLKELFRQFRVVGADICELSPLPGSRLSEYTAARLMAKILTYFSHFR